VTGDEVITKPAEPLARDVSSDSAASSAGAREVSESGVVSEPGGEPPFPPDGNGAAVETRVQDAEAAITEDNSSSSGDAQRVDEGVSEAPVPDSANGAIEAEAVDCDDSKTPASEDVLAINTEVTGSDSIVSEADDSSYAEAEPLTDEPVTDDAGPDEVRRQLVRRFEMWLDRMAEGEPPPEGLPEELLADALETREPADSVGADLYSVFAGLTKLSGEIGLQGRAFRQLADVLAPSAQVPARLERLEAAQNAVARELARQAESDESELPGSEDVLAVLFDLYDRLNRGLQNFDASYEAARSSVAPVGFLQRLRGGGKANADLLAAPAAAMREGYRLTLSRLEAALLQWGIQRTGEVGEPFDPQRMAVVEVGTAPGAPDGSVLEVYRSGYVVNGRVLATARVKVAKAGQVR